MWTRKEIKQRAKEALRRNYWKIVLVSGLLMFLGGTCSYSHSGSVSSSAAGSAAQAEQTAGEQDSGSFVVDVYDVREEIGTISDTLDGVIDAGQEAESAAEVVPVVLMIAMFAVVFIIVCAVAIVVKVFLGNPLIVGADRFMVKSMEEKAQVKEIAYGFDHAYLHIVKTMFFKGLYVSLWSLLFLVPGVYKSYQYRMVPYLLAQQPQMPWREALQTSKAMMQGQKWKAFVLDLSFLPWHALGLITCGILEIFYVAPYQNLTNAELYRTIGVKPDGIEERV